MKEIKDFNLLFVDDEEALRDLMAYDFKKKGFNVMVANSGDSAFAVIETNKIDLVISDMRMPGGDGMSLLENIRRKYPNLPNLIFVTGHSDVHIEECLAKGAKKVLYKPFDRKELMRTVMIALELEA